MSPKKRSILIAPSKQTVTICLLEDDSSVLKATKRLLSSAGWKVESFLDPIAFLDYAKARHPEVAILDILMPTMNGLEVQSRLRVLSPSTRVIVLTSTDDPIVQSTAMRAGASAFFLKPANNERFLTEIESAASRT